MTIETAVFERIVLEAKQKERERAIDRITAMMDWTTRFGGFDAQYKRNCATVIYDQSDWRTA